MGLHGALNRASRALSRKNRAQVRVPKAELGARQAVVLSVASGPLSGGVKTAQVQLANSAKPFTAAYSSHYVPVAGDTCWVLFVGSSPLILCNSQ